MKHTNNTILLAAFATLLAACSSGPGEPDDRPAPTTAPLELYIAVPSPTSGGTRTTFPGDPGTPSAEASDWDRLTLIVAYTAKASGDGIVDADPGKTVYYDTFSKTEFDCRRTDGTLNTDGVAHASSTLVPILAADGSDTGYRSYTMHLPMGAVRVYGVTYSSECSSQFDFEKMVAALPHDGKDHNADIADLQISNGYATRQSAFDASKFVSVATGYALSYKDETNPTPDLYISKDNESEMHQYWSMTLHRLATKIDIQWDAYEAYNAKDNAYTYVDVDAFTYNGGSATSVGSGYGRLFPFAALHHSGYTFSAVGGQKAFVNTSAISKRNGRVCHYVFPDGSDQSTVTFNLTTQRSDEAASKQRTYTYQFVQPLQPATWYKVNTTIRGNDQANTTLTVDRFATGE